MNNKVNEQFKFNKRQTNDVINLDFKKNDLILQQM
jgi:hypothetical protein